jgi:replicative DNA helicase
MQKFNREAEIAVLGSILQEGYLFKELQVKEQHFYLPEHIQIFRAMQQVDKNDQEIDFVTVATVMADNIQEVGGVSYLSDLANSVPSTASINHYERLMLDSYVVRESQKHSLKFYNEPGREDLGDLIKNLQQLDQLGMRKAEKTKNDYLTEIASDMMEANPNMTSGFKTSFDDLDRMTGGLQKQDLIIVAARPSVGKTAFALNIGSGHCSNGGTTHLFSLEMGTKALLQRLIAAEASVDSQKWRSMQFNEQDYSNALNAIGVLSQWDIEIHEKVNTVTEIRAELRKAVKDNPDGNHLAVIDYLQLITPTGKHDRRDLEVGAMTRELKLLAIELDIPIILLSQLSRGVEQRQDKRPMMSDLRESGNIEQDADVIAFLYRDDYYDKQSEKQNIIEIILSKQRNGPTGTVELAFLKEYGRFANLSKIYQEAK